MIVVDTNILSYFYLRDQFGPEADALLAEHPRWVVPVLWRSEFRNTLIGYVRRGRMTLDQATGFVDEAMIFLKDTEHMPATRDILELAQASGCTAYDCEFVALAKELGVKLFTMDRQILKAFPDIAVPLTSD
jgi:predicted nucleic acid-binding protein